jgi:uncharacterized protein
LGGLKLLIKKQTDYPNAQISVNAVYAPPFSIEKIEMINKEMKTNGLSSIMISYPSEATIPLNLVSAKDLDEELGLLDWAFKKYDSDYSDADPMVKGIIENKMARIYQRLIFASPMKVSQMNGCCLPGYRKNYVSTDGKIRVCERISTYAPSIGNVFFGYDISTIKKVYIEDYAEKSLEYCSTCWINRICDLCYISAFNNRGDLDFQKKRKYCEIKIEETKKVLRYFVKWMEKKPEKIAYLEKYAIN